MTSTPTEASAKVRIPRAGTPMLTDRERLVLSLLLDEKVLTRSALIRRSGLSGTAVFRATEELAAKGMITLGEPRAEGRGQPSHAVSINSGALFSVGLSVMTDLAEMLIMDLGGNRLRQQVVATENLSRQDLLGRLEEFIADAERSGIVARRRLHSLGIAVAGYFVGEGSKVNPARELDDWALIDLEPMLEDRLGVGVTVENIANASAMGEQLLGLGRRFADFAYVNEASGFGGGLIRGGKLWRGVNGNAGEFAAMLRVAGLPAPNLERLRECLAERGVETVNVRDMLARFDPAWSGVDAWIEQSCPVFATLAELIHYALDVQAVVLGGRLPTELALRLAEGTAALLGDRHGPPRRGRSLPLPRVLPAEISSSAAAVGAAAIPLARDFFGSISHLEGN